MDAVASEVVAIDVVEKGFVRTGETLFVFCASGFDTV